MEIDGNPGRKAKLETLWLLSSSSVARPAAASKKLWSRRCRVPEPHAVMATSRSVNSDSVKATSAALSGPSLTIDTLSMCSYMW